MDLLTDWVNQSEENKTYFQRQLNDWASHLNKTDAPYFDKNQAYQRFNQRVRQARLLNKAPKRAPAAGRSITRTLTFKVASCAAILLILIAAAYYLRQSQSHNTNTNSHENQSVFQQIKVPAGSRQQITLPDKTVVWINAGSTFKYPTTFKGDTRTVYLNGEGYFQVAKDAQHPFIVKTAKGSVTVTGTTFDVYAYDSSPRFETALLEGHVNVQTPDGQTARLLPHQKAELKAATLSVSPIEDADQYRWREGLICFDNKPITEVLKELQTAFGQKIIIQHLDEPQLLLTGKFRVSDGLAYALKVLKDSYGLKFKKDSANNTYIIIN